MAADVCFHGGYGPHATGRAVAAWFRGKEIPVKGLIVPEGLWSVILQKLA